MNQSGENDPRPDPATWDVRALAGLTDEEKSARWNAMLERAIEEELAEDGPLRPGDISTTKGSDVPMVITTAWHDVARESLSTFARVVDSRLHTTHLPSTAPRAARLLTAPMLHLPLGKRPVQLPVLSRLNAATACAAGPIAATGGTVLVLIPLDPTVTSATTTSTTLAVDTFWLRLLTITFDDARPDLIVLEQVTQQTAANPHQYQASVLCDLAVRVVDHLARPRNPRRHRLTRRTGRGTWLATPLPDPPTDPLPPPPPAPDTRTSPPHSRPRDEDSR
ncbi:hypothetical protein [Cellulomonas soli]